MMPDLDKTDNELLSDGIDLKAGVKRVIKEYGPVLERLARDEKTPHG